MQTTWQKICVFLLSLVLSQISSQKIQNLGGINENALCVLRENPRVHGVCMRINNCQHEFDAYRKNQSVLKICKFNAGPMDTIICCPQNATTNTLQEFNHMQMNSEDFASIETCRNRFLSLRKSQKSVYDLVDAILLENRSISTVDCMNIHLYGKPQFDCNNGTLETFNYILASGEPVEVEWQNIAAIGWTQDNEKVEFKCVGTIISEKFIITAAHCNDRGKNPDIVRLGDRFLHTAEDDRHSQQFKVEKFIPHPNFKHSEAYDDIAVIKVDGIILFNKFVAPACISDVDDISFYPEWKITGYGQVSEI